jgi:hypothetical protein
VRRDSEVAIVFSLARPYDDFASALVDVPHVFNLFVPLMNIVLIDAHCNDPGEWVVQVGLAAYPRLC